MAKNITTAVTILGKDALSPVVTSATNKSITQLQKLNKQSASIASGAFGVARTTAVAGAGIMTPLIYAGKEAALFEKEMVGLGKVANIDLGSKELAAVSEQAKEAAFHLGRMPTSVALSMKALKQSGVILPELKNIAVFTGEAGVAFDMTADQAGTAFGSINAAMGQTLKQTRSTFDAINEISNKMGATPERIISFFTAGGAGVANSLKIQGAEIAAFGATLIQAGKSGEEAATLMEKIAKNTISRKPIKAAYDAGGGGTEGLLNVLRVGNAMPKDRKDKYFSLFGEYALEIKNLAENMTGPRGLLKALELVSAEEKYAQGVHKEFTAVQKSTIEQANKAWVGFKINVIDFGTQALPIFNKLLQDIKPVLAQVGSWIKANPELTATSIKAAAGLAVFAFGVSGVAAVVGAVAKSITAVTVVLGWFKVGGAMAGVTASVTSFGGALWSAAAAATVLGAPLWAVVAVAAAVGYAFYKAYEHVEPFHKMIISLTTAVQSLGDHVGPMFSKLAGGDFKGAWGELVAANNQTKLNVASHMGDYRRDKPANFGLPALATNRIDDIEKNRRDRELKALGRMGDKSNTGSYGILERLGLGNPTKQFEKPAPVLPANLKGVNTGTSISVNSNPIFNFSGPVSAEDKKDMLNLAGDMARNLAKELEAAQRNKKRLALE